MAVISRRTFLFWVLFSCAITATQGLILPSALAFHHSSDGVPPTFLASHARTSVHGRVCTRCSSCFVATWHVLPEAPFADELKLTNNLGIPHASDAYAWADSCFTNRPKENLVLEELVLKNLVILRTRLGGFVE